MSDSDFKAVFFEEAAEHLQAIENELLTLDGDPENEEALNGVFRAAHSIKGSAGMFGFNELSGFTHHLETLLDLIRKGEAELTDERVELTLQATDEIRAMVDHLAEGGDELAADPVLTQALIDALKDVLPEASTLANGEDASPSLPDDDAFGLFEEEPEDDSFGLFDDTPDDSAADNSAPGDESFGLFEDVAGEAGNDAADEADGQKPGAYQNYFDEMFGGSPDDESPAKEPGKAVSPESDTPALGSAPSTDGVPDTTAESAEPESGGDEPDADGRFGWLNRPDVMQAQPESGPASGPVKPEPAPAGKRSKPAGAASAGSASMRVSLEKVDELVNQISELVITQAMLQETGKNLEPAANEQHLGTLEVLERNTRELQESILSMRLLPVSFMFSRFPRVVRDLARKLGKQVDLVQLGEQTELDKSLIEKLADPLTHLVRNSIDHGIEMPAQRVAEGKPEKGQVVMTAAHEGGTIMISISDDGAGIDRDKILAKAAQSGFDVHDGLSDEQVFSLLFEPGFSTAAQVTDISGRGVGMDVVKRNIKELGGTIEVQSTLGQGSNFIVRLPLTLAITDGMVVRAGEERYVIPLSNVVESLQLGEEEIFEVQGNDRVIRRHGEYLILMDLAATLDSGLTDSGKRSCLVVVVENEGLQTGLVIDELIGQQQVVIKNLEANYRKVAGFSGATVMGDGSVAFILDITHFVQEANKQMKIREAKQ
jgi:two-component system chemotaxis sensor kinase CheA